MKIKLEIEVEIDASIFFDVGDEDSTNWFFDEVLLVDRLILRSKEIGDEIGEVTKLKLLEMDGEKCV